MDEFTARPANGFDFRWVSFRFELSGNPSDAAVYNSPIGPGQTLFVQQPAIIGPTAGVLFIDFFQPTPIMEMGFGLERTAPQNDAIEMRLFDAADELIDTVSLRVQEEKNLFWAEAFFGYESPDRPIARAECRFDPAAARLFAADNLVFDAPCTDISVTPANPVAPAELTLEATGIDDCGIVEYSWDFGDEGFGEGRTVTHTYEAPGRYGVVLEVTHENGWRAAVTHAVSVGCAPSGDSGDWTVSEIGEVTFPTSVTVEEADGSACMDICAGGLGILDDSDSFVFAHQALVGDATITARVDSVLADERFSKVGVMVRASTDVDAPYAGMFTEFRSDRLQYKAICREIAGVGDGCSFLLLTARPPNAWVRAQRRGDRVAVLRSTDGVEWEEYDSFRVDLGEEALFGIAATMNDFNPAAGGNPIQARVCDVTIEGGDRPETRFDRGDANADGQLNLTDAVFVLGYLFSGGDAPTCIKSADVDDGGEVILTDAVGLLVFLFQQGAPPPAPRGECGNDPSDDALSCESFSPCS